MCSNCFRLTFSAHWKLAIVCYPGRFGEETQDTKDQAETESKENTDKKEGKGSMFRRKDSKKSKNQDITVDDEEEPKVPTTLSQERIEEIENKGTEGALKEVVETKMPCILILDSLGSSKYVHFYGLC